MKRFKRMLVVTAAVAGSLAACNHDSATPPPPASPSAPAPQAKKASASPQKVPPQKPITLKVIPAPAPPAFPSLAEVKSFLTGDLVSKMEAPHGLKVVTKKTQSSPMPPRPPGMKIAPPPEPNPEADTEELVTLESGLKIAYDSKTNRSEVLNLGGCGLRLIRDDKEDLDDYLSNSQIYVKAAQFLTTEPRHVFQLYQHAFARQRIPAEYGGFCVRRENPGDAANSTLQRTLNAWEARAALVTMQALKDAYGEKRLSRMSFEDLDHQMDDPRMFDTDWMHESAKTIEAYKLAHPDSDH